MKDNQTMHDHLISLTTGFVGLFIVPLLSMALYRVLHRLADKLHIDFTTTQEQQLRSLTDESVRAAEEWAAARLKNGVKPDGSDKLNFAVEHLQANLPGLTAKSAIDMIKGALPRLGLGAAVKAIGKAIA